jgi:hypothetical protein
MIGAFRLPGIVFNTDVKFRRIHLFVIIPADAINNPVKMEHFSRIERAIRTEPPNVLSYHKYLTDSYLPLTPLLGKYPNVVYFVTQIDEPSRGGDVLLSSHPHQFEASELWATYKKKEVKVARGPW